MTFNGGQYGNYTLDNFFNLYHFWEVLQHNHQISFLNIYFIILAFN